MSGLGADRTATYMNTTAVKAAGIGLHGNLSALEAVKSYEGARLHLNAKYRTEYYNATNDLVWVDEYEGLVVTDGLNKILDACFKTGLASPAWYVGLIDGTGTPVLVAADLMSSHAGWSEFAGYSESVRQTWTPGTIAAGAVSNSGAQAIFTINADGQVFGTFLTTVDTKSGATGILYDEGQFTEGTHLVYNGGSMHCTVRLTATAVQP